MRYLIIMTLLIAGCTVAPQYTPPAPDVPCDWQGEVGCSMQRLDPDDLTWWKNFQDPLLNQLIEYAANQNLDLAMASMRVLQARLEAKGKKADLFPHIDGSAACGHANLPKGFVKGLKRSVNFYEVGFDADWEIDLFGMTAHEIKALLAQEEAAQENLNGVWVTLSAEIAKNYIELRGLQTRLQLIQTHMYMQKESLGRLHELSERGINSEIDLNNAQAELHSLEAEEPLIQLNISQTIHRLSVLLGYPPGDLADCLRPVNPLPQVPCEQAVGYPSDLLRRRPDIRKAERELAAATERVGSAIAALFPRFSLRGFIGDISAHAGHLFSPKSATSLVGPQLLVPIFNSRLLLQDVQYNKIATQNALYNYQKTVLEALEEAENSIAAFRSEEERLAKLQASLESFQKASAFSQQLYERGVYNYHDVVVAEKNSINAQTSLIQSQVDLLLHYVALYKALGGSWEDCSESCANPAS